MPSRWRLRSSALLAFVAAASSSSPGRAQTPDAAATPSSANVAAARRHFERAREEYGKGAYREAIGELEAAHTLDPTAKDLVFNLGVVHEKLSDIDDALDWFQLYTTMNVTPTERDRADSYIRRLEGAKRELAQKPAPPTPSRPSPPSPETPPSLPPRAAPSAPHGRVDTATVTAASLAGVAVVVGAVMAVKADLDRPVANYITGQDGTLAALQARVDSAHREAVIADAAFGVSIAAGITATVLYFARTRDVPKFVAPVSSGRRDVPGSVTVSAAPLAGGGAVFLRGSL